MAEREAMRLVALMVGSLPCPAVQARVRLPAGSAPSSRAPPSTSASADA